MTITETWCRTYTRLVPSDEADRRQQEIASHMHEAVQQGVSRPQLCAETVIGAMADLLWSDRVRRSHGLVPLWLIPLVDASIGAIAGGTLILLTLALAIATPAETGSHWAEYALGYIALVLVLSGHATGIVRRLRR